VPSLPARPQLQSTWARATVPVLGGLGFFAVLAVVLWGVAALISGGGRETDTLASRTFEPGSAASWAEIVERDGPVIFPDLLGTDGDKTVVLDHQGDDPLSGWSLYLAHPADRPIECKVTQVRFSRQFTDCDGRTLAVTDLAPPPDGVFPVVSPTDGVLTLDLLAGTGTLPPTSDEP
jgi:hypothetical protein